MRWAGAFCVLLGVLLAATAPARADGQPPPPCTVPAASIMKSPQAERRVWDLEKLGDSWRAEAQKIGDRLDVWRYFDRLYLATGNGNVAVLTDCPFGDGSRVYRYEKYDEVGDFHLARTEYYEDSGYTLVSSKSGLAYALMSLPVWSPDRTKFFHARCYLTGPNQLSVARPAEDGLRTEISIDLPCDAAVCESAWTSASTIVVTCPGNNPGSAPKTLRLTFQAGQWLVTSN